MPMTAAAAIAGGKLALSKRERKNASRTAFAATCCAIRSAAVLVAAIMAYRVRPSLAIAPWYARFPRRRNASYGPRRMVWLLLPGSMQHSNKHARSGTADLFGEMA